MDFIQHMFENRRDIVYISFVNFLKFKLYLHGVLQLSSFIHLDGSYVINKASGPEIRRIRPSKAESDIHEKSRTFNGI